MTLTYRDMLRRTSDGEHFTLSQPLATHFRKASCKEAECPHYRFGWVTIVPTGSAQDLYIQYKSERVFTREQINADQIRYIFPPGQRCFRIHYLQKEMLPILTHRKGSDTKRFKEMVAFTDTMNETVARIEQRRKGV